MIRFFTYCLLLGCFTLVTFSSSTQRQASAQDSGGKDMTVLVLGDSNTYSGHYVAVVEAYVRKTHGDKAPAIINLGLPSETACGLSEPDHPFPRPDVHERLDRALEKIDPDIVLACYGVNDAIYAPLSDERFNAYKDGITRLVDKVQASGAKCVLCTPPAFDPLPMRKSGKLQPSDADNFSWKAIYEGYDKVIETYANWVQTMASDTVDVIDLHGALQRYVSSKRESDPDFTLSKDGVHVNHEGHRVLAMAILEHFKIPTDDQPDAEFIARVEQRQRLLRDAWLTEVGHKRPGVKEGLPLAEAQAKADKLP